MNKFLSAIKSLFSDEHGTISMKRLCGLLCTIALCVTMYQNSFTKMEVAPSKDLVDAVAMLAFGCLGLSSIDKIWGKTPKSAPTNTAEPAEAESEG
jgi:hypothetical protein